MRLICIKEFSETELRRLHSAIFEIGKSYEYWTNFGGLNHIVVDDNGNKYPFQGPMDKYESVNSDGSPDTRPHIFEYFKTISEVREDKLNDLGI